MHHHYVLIEEDNEGELIYKTLYQQNFELELHSATNGFPIWLFRYEDNDIIVYGVALKSRPVGENREEIEQRILLTLDLI